MRAMLIALALGAASAQAAPPTLDDLLRPARHDIVTISPGGEYIAATVRRDERVLLAIIDRSTLKPIRVLDPEEDGAIERVSWVSNDRIFVMNSRVGPMVEQAYLEPYVIAVNVDGSKRRVFRSAIVDTLLHDDEHVLIERCGKASIKGCWPYVMRVGTEGERTGERVAEAPLLNANFTMDAHGVVRFAHAYDETDVQRVRYFDGAAWKALNDEDVSGVEVTPIGVSRDGARGYVLSERKDGPDVIEEVQFATGARRMVLSDPELEPEYIVWSVDGGHPIGAAFGTGVPRARFWDASDPDALLLRKLEAAFPEDAVRFVSGTQDGARAVVRVEGDRDPGSYYLLERVSLKLALIARARDWLSPDALAVSKPVRIPSRDGLELHGYLTEPPVKGNAPLPLVVLPHGGPFGVKDGWFYDDEVQMLAAHGYAVLRVNFRGSDGRGRAFEELGHLQWGLRMQDDVTDATQWAVKTGRFDAARICIFGSSYGGYAALMGAIREPALYRCAISTAGLTDLNIHWKWGDTHRSRYGRNFLEQTMGRDAKQLYERSPVKHAAQLQPALMLVHGMHDYRVSYEHAKAMRRALDAAGKPYEGYFPEDETHGIYGEKNRAEYYRRVLAFLARHIGGRSPAPAAAR